MTSTRKDAYELSGVVEGDVVVSGGHCVGVIIISRFP